MEGFRFILKDGEITNLTPRQLEGYNVMISCEDDNVFNLIRNVFDNSRRLSDNSEYPEGTLVKISDNEAELYRYFRKEFSSCSNNSDLISEVRLIKGQIGLVQSVANLTDSNGKWDLFYDVELNSYGSSSIHPLPSKFLERV